MGIFNFKKISKEENLKTKLQDLRIYRDTRKESIDGIYEHYIIILNDDYLELMRSTKIPFFYATSFPDNNDPLSINLIYSKHFINNILTYKDIYKLIDKYFNGLIASARVFENYYDNELRKVNFEDKLGSFVNINDEVCIPIFRFTHENMEKLIEELNSL